MFFADVAACVRPVAPHDGVVEMGFTPERIIEKQRTPCVMISDSTVSYGQDRVFGRHSQGGSIANEFAVTNFQFGGL